MDNWTKVLKNNNIAEVKKLIEQGENVNAENESGESVLAYALRCRCEFDILMLLVENGADIFDTDNEGVSIFDMAITYNNIAMVNYLLDNGVNVNNTTRKSGFTPLMCAACYGRTKIVKILLDKGSDKKAVDYKGFSATDFARKMHKRSVLELLGYDNNVPKNTEYAR